MENKNRMRIGFVVLVVAIVLIGSLAACKSLSIFEPVMLTATLDPITNLLMESPSAKFQLTTAAPAPLTFTKTPTNLFPTTRLTAESSTMARPTAKPTSIKTLLSPEAEVLKDIVFSDCIPVEESLPDDIELPWNLLVRQDFSTFIFDPIEGTTEEVPRFDERTPEGYYKFLTEIFISPDGNWLAYSNNDNTQVFVEPAETLIENKDTDRIIIEKDHWFGLRQWVDNDTLFVVYPALGENEFYPTVFLNPFIGAEHEFLLEEMPDYLDNLMTGLITTHYHDNGNLSPDPTMKKLVYPALGNDHKIFNTLWDIKNNYALAQVGFMIGDKNDPLWSQDGADFLIMGPNQDFGQEWFLITENGVVRQITQFSDIFQNPNYYISGSSRSWDGQFLAFEIFYLIEKPEEDLKFIILDLSTSSLEGYCIPMSVVSWGLDSPIWSPDSKYLVISDNDERTGYGDIILVDIESKVRYKIGQDMDVIGWIVKP